MRSRFVTRNSQFSVKKKLVGRNQCAEPAAEMTLRMSGMFCFVCAGSVAIAQTQTPTTITPISLTQANTTTPYTQNFDTLANAGASNTVPPGWGFVESGTAANTTYNTGTGSNNTGDTYSFGPVSSIDRAFGTLQSGSLIPSIGAVFTNNSGVTLLALTINYAGEEWRLGNASRIDRLDFQYNTSASSLTGSSDWVDFNSLDFSTPDTAAPTGAKNGNSAAEQSALGGTVGGLSIANGQSFAIRWLDFDASGSDDGLAIDNFSATIATVPEPSNWIAALLALCAVAYSQRRRVAGLVSR